MSFFNPPAGSYLSTDSRKYALLYPMAAKNLHSEKVYYSFRFHNLGIPGPINTFEILWMLKSRIF